MKKIYLIIVYALILLPNFSQNYTYYDVHLKGKSTLHQFITEQTYTISKEGGDWHNLVYTIKAPLCYGSNNAVLNNTQYRYSYDIITASGITKTHSLYQDIYGNDWLNIEISVAPTYIANSFDVTIEYVLEEKVNLAVNDPNDAYPLIGIPSNISSTYLSATDIIDSDNSAIISKASSISNGYSTEFKIVNEFARWIKSNVAYVKDAPEKASDVLSSRTGDCDGMSNLMIAFCRSMGIPARINVGYSIKIEKKYPYINQCRLVKKEE